MIGLIIRSVEASYRHAALVVATMVLLAIAGGVYTAQHISIDTDINKLISADLPWRQREAQLDRAFPQNAGLLAIVIDGATPDQAEDAATALAERLAADPVLFKNVRRPDGGPFFQRNGLLFLPVPEVQEFADQLIAAQPLIGTLAADPSLRGVFTAIDLAAQGVQQGQIQADALDSAFSAVAEASEAAVAGRYAPMSWQTLLTGRKPDTHELRRFVLAQPLLDFSSLEPGERARTAVRQAAQDLGLTPDRGVRVRITGSVALNDEEFATLAEGAGFSTALSIALLCLWLLLALRSGRLVGTILITLAVGLITCATFAVGVVGPLNPISVAFAVLFVGLAVDFSIQFSVRYREERFRERSLRAALRQTAKGIGGPLAIAASATAVGFFSFIPTDYTGVSDLGLIAGVGMLVALLLNVTLLPALLALLRPRGEARPVGFAWAAPLDRFLRRRRRAVIAVSGLLAVGCIATMPWLRFDFNPINLKDPRTESVSTLFDLMADPQTTPYTIDILAPSVRAAGELATRLESLPEVAQAVYIGSYVPTDQPQKLAILADARTLLGPTLTPAETKPPPSDDEILQVIAKCAADVAQVAERGDPAAQRLSHALAAVGLRGAAVLPLLKADLSEGVPRRLQDLRLALDAEPITLDTLPPDLKSAWIAVDGTSARVEVFPKGDARDNAVLRRFVTAVRAIAPDATGTPVTIQESANTVTRAFLIAGVTALAAIAVLLLIVLRSGIHVLLVVAPLLLAGLLTLATSVLTGLPLNFANIIALPLLLGIGVAFDIYFVMRWRAGDSGLLQSSTARAILFSALTTGTAFGSLALANHPGTSEMGKLLTLSLFYTLCCTFFVLPALLDSVKR